VAQTHFRSLKFKFRYVSDDATRVPRLGLPGPQATKLVVRTSEIEKLESVQSTPQSARISTSVFGPVASPQVCYQESFELSPTGMPSRGSVFAPVHSCLSFEERDRTRPPAQHAVVNAFK
jgi:hypothetical protein